MGFEEFSTIVECCQPKPPVVEWLREQGFVASDSFSPSYSRFLWEDAHHIVEAEVSERDGRARVCAQFALCQLDTVVPMYGEIIKRLARRFDATVTLLDPVSADDAFEFPHDGLDALDQVLKSAIADKRALWVADAGSARAKSTCAEAVQHFVAKQEREQRE